MQALVNGVVTGAVLALPTIAFSLVYGTLGFPNAALAALVILGSYIGLTVNGVFGVHYVVAAAAAGLIVAPLAAILGRVVFKQFQGQATLAPLVASVGLLMVLENVVRMIWGNDMKSLDMTLHRPWSLFKVRLNPDQATVAGFAIALVILTFAMLKYTPIGRRIRAVGDDNVLAGVRGIDVGKTVLVVWLIAGVLCGAAGVLLGADTVVSPGLGWSIALPMFAGAILGGIGSPLGAFAGAILMGLISEISVLFMPPTYKSAIAFGVMVLLLLIKPEGLLKVKL